MSNSLDFIMQQTKKMQDELGKIEQELVQAKIVGESGAGMVQAHMSFRKGQQEVKKFVISDEVMAEEKQVLQDLLVAAVNDGLDKLERYKQEKLGGIASHMDLQSLFNLKN